MDDFSRDAPMFSTCLYIVSTPNLIRAERNGLSLWFASSKKLNQNVSHFTVFAKEKGTTHK